MHSLRVVAALAFSAGLVLPAAAVTVSNILDAGPGSLRDAVLVTPNGGTVDFAPGLTGTILLTSGEIAFAKSLAIDGAGTTVVVSGSNARIFSDTDGTTTLIVRNLTLENGRANAGSSRGGAIATSGAVIIDSVWFRGNQAVDGGGAIYVARAAGTLGRATIRNSAFTGNSVTGAGGAGGGAILVAGTASGPQIATLSLLNTTISGNSANASVGMAGGGIAIATATVSLISSTIAGNSAGAAGADLHQGTLASTTVTLTNSIVGAGSIAALVFDPTDRDLYQPGGMGNTSGGYNVIQQRSGATFAATDAPNGTDPLLVALADNGGPTPTQALGASSPARNFVPLANCLDNLGAPLTRDQRNGARGVGGDPCDAGAYEVQIITLAPATVPDGSAGTFYSQTFTATGGMGTIGFALGGTLPAGLGLDAVTGVLSGTPTAVGTFNFTVTASDAFGDSTGAVAYSITIAPGAPAALFYLQAPSNVIAGAAIAPAVVVQVRDAFGNPVTTAAGSVTLAIGNNPGAGTLSGTSTQPLVNGAATFGNLSLNKTGAGYTLVATSGALSPLPSIAFNVVAGAPALLAFGSQPTNALAGNAIAPAVTVQIQDALGNLTASAANVTIAIGTNPGGGTLAGTATVAAVGGIATFANLSIDKVGTGYTLAASSAGVAGAASNAFNITAGAAAKLVYGQQPTNTVSGQAITPAITLMITDNFGNLTASAANVTLAIGANPGGGTLSGTATVAAVNGTATFGGLSIDKAGTGYTLVAASAGLAGATSNAFNIIVGAPANLVFGQQPTNVAAGTSITPAITVQITDANGNLTSSAASVTLAIANNPGGGTLSGTLTVVAAAGTATFGGLAIDKVGTGYTLAAASAGLTGATSTAFNVSAGAPSRLVFGQQPTTTTAGSPMAPALTVRILDAAGNPTSSAANVTIAIGNNPGGGVLSGTLTVAAVAGTATFANLSIDKAGTGYTLTASSAGLTGATSTAFDINVGAATRLVFAQAPTNTAAGAPIAPSVTVQITDAAGNPTASTANVTIAIGANPGGGILSGTLTMAAVNGTATFANLAIDKIGIGYTLAASSAGVTGVTSAAFNIVAGGATRLVFGQQPANVTAGSVIAPAVTVQIVDASGNLTSSTATVTLALGANPGGATLSGTLSVAAVNGTATFPTLSLNKAATGYTLAATSAGLAGATSTAFNVTAGAPTHLAFLQQPSSSAPAVAITPSVTVQLLDAFDNIANSAATVTLAIGTNPSAGVLSGTTSAAAVAGTATFAGLAIDKTGVGYTLVASSGALPSVTSTAFDITNRLLTVALPGGGVVTVALAGGGSGCSFASGGYVPLTGGAGSPPAGSAPSGYAFPYGLANFTATPCTGTVTLTYAFPAVLPPATVFWKFGPTAAVPAFHWYPMPATIAGNTAVVSITDGGLGDDDLAANGTIVDPAGVGIAIGLAASIPTLGPSALALLALLLFGFAALQCRRRR